MIQKEIERLMAAVEKDQHRAMDPCLFSAIAEKLAEYVGGKIAEAQRKYWYGER